MEKIKHSLPLRCKLVSPGELTKFEKILLACKGKDFYFIRDNGVLKINNTLPNPDHLARIAVVMWQYDQLADERQAQEIEALLEQVSEIAGEEAAGQILEEWSNHLCEKRDAEDKRAAAEWLQRRDIADELDAICETIGDYRPGFIKALWSQSLNADAVFLYGYQVGMDAAHKAKVAQVQ